MNRRIVKVDPLFFEELDAQLGPDRGPNGEPSSSDFLVIDLPTISAAFAEHFDDFPPLYSERGDYRYLLTVGKLAQAILVTGQLTSDGSVVLFGVDIDP